MEEAIGWISSGILVLTVGKQVYKQWKTRTSEGVSKWLFIGQLAASIGFVVYSWLVENWVFVATNSLMVANALAGALIVYLQRRRGAPRAEEEDGAKARRASRLHGPLPRGVMAAGRARGVRPLASSIRSRGGGKLRRALVTASSS
ncbi:MAG TPA: PQ-loop repeat-containing protein [Sorangium sp.]|nr:PQ-loop repeat-containing protein [Sorangium sp.]